MSRLYSCHAQFLPSLENTKCKIRACRLLPWAKPQNLNRQASSAKSFALYTVMATGLVESGEGFILSLEKAEADLKMIAHRLEEGFEQHHGRAEV